MNIDTPKGKIEAKLNGDTEYPGIDIFINGMLAVVVEYDSHKDALRIHSYNDTEEGPVAHVFWDATKPNEPIDKEW